MPSESLPENRDVWRIAAPMILSNISVPLLGMVDTGVTGHLENPAYLGAVAIGATIFGFLYSAFNFLRMGTTGIAAQGFGANDDTGVRVVLGQALVVSTALALVMLLAQVPIANLSLYVLGGDADVRTYAAEYFYIRVWSAPATLANYALIGWFIGLQNARVPLYIVLTINVINIALDLVFVLVLGMKVDGVAAASVIAEFSGLFVGLAFALPYFRDLPKETLFGRLKTISGYRQFFSINANLFVRSMALMFTFAFVTAAGARLGSLILAANAILLNALYLMSFALDGFAHAAEALVGKAVGARNKAALERSVALSLQWSLYVALFFCLLFLVGGKLMVVLLTDLEAVIATANQYLWWIVALPIIGVWSFLYDGVFVGATRAREMRDIMLISSFLVFLPAWWLTQDWGNHGLWFALSLFLASRGIGMHYYYHRRVLPAV